MLAIDRALYADAADLLAQANQTLATTGSDLFDGLSEAVASAGEGNGARSWCSSYEQAARSVTDEISQLTDAFGKAATLLDTSGHNHASAEAAAAPYGLSVGRLPRRNLEHVTISGVPPMYGGNDGEPWGWHLIVGHLHGFGWPGADIDRIRSLAAAWHAAADNLQTATYFPALASSYLDTMSSPELPAATSVCKRLADVCTALAADCDALGRSCGEYADAVARARTQVTHAFKELLGVAGVGALVGLGATVLSGGLAGLASGTLEGTAAGTLVSRIVSLLDALASTLSALNPAMAINDAQGGQSAWLRTVADAAPVLAAVTSQTGALAAELGGVPRGGGAVGTMTDDEVIRAGWADRRTLQDHFDRHGADVGATSTADYVRTAQELRARAEAEGLPMKVDKDGTIRIFDPQTGLFASFRPDGRARTIFRPTPSPDAYWAKQPGALK